VSWQSAVELALAAGAVVLLGRDLYRAWHDEQRRPMSLLVAGLMVVLLAGVLGGRQHPHSWWLAIPAAILGWEAGIGAFALALALAALGLVIAALAASISGFALLWLSHRREPRPWRLGDVSHYERRAGARTKAPDAG
jgi:hypothetical protein